MTTLTDHTHFAVTKFLFRYPVDGVVTIVDLIIKAFSIKSTLALGFAITSWVLAYEDEFFDL